MTNSALIFAAGKGTRMLPLTNKIPKALAEYKCKTLLEYRIEQLKNLRFQNIVINSHWKAEVLEEYINKNHPDIKISHEEVLLDTGGGFKNALPLLDNDWVYLINCDMIFDAKKWDIFQKLAEKQQITKSKIILGLVNIKNTSGYEGSGDFIINDDGELEYLKTSNQQLATSNPIYIFSGIQLFHKSALEPFMSEEIFSLSKVFKYYQQKQELDFVATEQNWHHIDNVNKLK